MKVLKGLQRVAVASGAALATLTGVASLTGEPLLHASKDESSLELLKDALLIWSEKSTEVGQAAFSLLGTIKDTCIVVLQGSSASDNLLRSFVSRVEEWSQHPGKNETLVVVGGTWLLNWLLTKAASKPSPDQIAAERAICHLLSDGATASALLQMDGAIPRLLQLVAQSEDAETLAQLLHSAADVVSLPLNASLDDLRDTIGLVNGQDGSLVRSVAVYYLGRWAESSVLNCGKIATMQGGPALGRALAAAGRTDQERSLCRHVTHAMAILARDCPLRSLLGTEAWLQQLLFLAADAAAHKDCQLVTRALDAFSICLMHGSNFQAALEGTTAWALLRKLAAQSDMDLRRAVTLAVTALSRHDIPEGQRQYWGSLLLAWLCTDKESGEAQRHSIAAALAMLASAPGSRGLSLASAWLGDMLVTLSHNVKTYSSIRVGGRDMVEEVTQDHVPVVPVFARSVAADLRDAYDRASAWQEPPIDMELPLRPYAMRPKTQELFSLEDAIAADAHLCRALKILCALVSSDDTKQRWLQSAGVVKLLQRLTLDIQMDIDGGDSIEDIGQKVMSQGTKRQCARLLAMVAASGDSQALMRSPEWLQWLRQVALSPDCKLSSHASRALLHIESAQAFQPSISQPVNFDKMRQTLEAQNGSCGPEASAAAAQAPNPTAAETLNPTGAANGGSRRLILKDGVHLFSPGSQHHHVLAREGIDSKSEGAPLVDIVFVHGIRGGPFASWRAGASPHRGRASENLTHNFCWPSEWLAADVPQARLLSLEYAAPASGWEGESLPLRGTVGQLNDKLAAAGVGQRPCIFVCHSMGGILTKEMLAKALTEAAPGHRHDLATTAAGLVFYATPHVGSWLADIGWTLRFVGASPAASVLHLRPGKHLEEVNDVIRQLHAERHMPVLSFGEGSPTAVLMTLPQLVVVPEGSAYPGYGDFVLLPGVDHINACKPLLREDASYAQTLKFIQRIVDGLQADDVAEL